MDFVGCIEHGYPRGLGCDCGSAVRKPCQRSKYEPDRRLRSVGILPGQSIKAAVLEAKSSQSAAAIAADKEKAASYQKEEVAIKAEAERKQAESKAHFHEHEVYARSVTLFQIAIAIAAISALTQRRSFWGVSLLAGVVGLVFFILGIAAH